VFEHTFGLTQQGLRAGGNAMLDADGQIGRTLFAAASGLTGRAQLERRCARMPRCCSRLLAAARRSSTGCAPNTTKARRAICERTATYEAWRELTEEIEGLNARREDIRRKRVGVLRDLHSEIALPDGRKYARRGSNNIVCNGSSYHRLRRRRILLRRFSL
jgi:hypothetical protein